MGGEIVTTLESLYAAINANPDDPSLLLLYADFLAERGEDDRGWRWLGERGKVPDDIEGWNTYSNFEWTFWETELYGMQHSIGPAGGNFKCRMPWCATPHAACQTAAANIVRLWGEGEYR